MPAEPIETTNLDIYGHDPLSWSRAVEGLEAGVGEASVGSGDPENKTFFLSTSAADGRPHAAGVGAIWIDGAVWFTSGQGTRKSRHLAANPRCAMAVTLPGLDLVIEGRARRVTDSATLEKLAEAYRAQGWPVQVEGEDFTAPYSAPSAGPAPWHLYTLDADVAFGVATAEPHGATRWRFR
jgi:Pyridoxamine 5'-phosphate oxidase